MCKSLQLPAMSRRRGEPLTPKSRFLPAHPCGEVAGPHGVWHGRMSVLSLEEVSRSCREEELPPKSQESKVPKSDREERKFRRRKSPSLR